VYTAPRSPLRNDHDVTVPFAGDLCGRLERAAVEEVCTPTHGVQWAGTFGNFSELPIFEVFADAAAGSWPTTPRVSPAVSAILVSRRFIPVPFVVAPGYPF